MKLGTTSPSLMLGVLSVMVKFSYLAGNMIRDRLEYGGETDALTQ